MNASEEIFRERFLPLYPRLFAVANAMLGDADDAADAVQDAMVKIWNGSVPLDAVSSPVGYAMQLLKTSAIDIIRRRRFTVHSPGGLPEPASTDDSEPDHADFLRRAIATLPPSQQEVIRMSAFGEMPAADIADTMGLTPENVRQLLSRGRRKLREIYQKYM